MRSDNLRFSLKILKRVMKNLMKFDVGMRTLMKSDNDDRKGASGMNAPAQDAKMTKAAPALKIWSIANPIATGCVSCIRVLIHNGGYELLKV